MKTRELRKAFLDFFQERQHTIVPSSSLVPANDPTLLFTNAGMVQFKDVFLGLEKRPYTRAASSQKCVRAGGKHNDLENVGYTARHHTFFEMLGNFSFGDYFKHEAIQYAWEFLTKVLKLPKERLWITVLEGDTESEKIWFEEIGIDQKRFSRCGQKDNFWSMGETGPCGPCTEIFYDHGEDVPGGPPGSPEEEGDRYIEIWNLVFMQYNRDQTGKLTPLPKPSVDTGSGLERLAAVMQCVHSNYEIDIFKHLISTIAKLAGTKDLQNKSLRVIADHIRSCVFLIADDVHPSNEGRGYVLRRICRRAIRHGFRLGLTDPFLHKLVKSVVEEMGESYPELVKSQSVIERILQQEEIQFARTLEQGLKILEQEIESLSGNMITGDTVFKLYDTYGFPVDLTADIAREREMTIDMAGFNEAMAAQKARAREKSHFTMDMVAPTDNQHTTDFTGYERLEEQDTVVALYRDNQTVSELKKDDKGSVVLNTTPFYAEAGGQVGDQGELYFESGVFEVHNTKKMGEAYLHIGVMQKGALKINDTVRAKVNAEKRFATELNHSATHLLHSALKHVVGPHVQQKGSLVDPTRLRFDFSHYEPLTTEQIKSIERLVNEKIRENSEAETEILPLEEALKTGAAALFGEKYGKTVRVLHMGNDFSVELCGGTHAKRTGDIGIFKIIAESGVAAGIRRIEALTGEEALVWVEKLQGTLNLISNQLNCSYEMIPEKVQQLAVKNKSLEKEIRDLKTKGVMSGSSDNLVDKAKDILGIKVLAENIPNMDIKTLRQMVDGLKNSLAAKSKEHTSVVVLSTVNDNKVSVVAGVKSDNKDKDSEWIHAGKLISYIADKIGGKGGGRADMAEGGGNQPGNIENALDSVFPWVEKQFENK